MKRLLAAAVVLTLVTAAWAQPATRPAGEQIAAEVLQEFRDLLWRELHPQLDQINAQDVQNQVAKLAAKFFEDKKQVFLDDGNAALAKLPKAEKIDRSKWKPAMEGKAVYKPEALRHEPDAKDPIGVYITGLWRADTAASVYRNLLLRQEMHQPFIKRMALEAYAPPAMEALESDPDKPVIVFRHPGELFVVKLKRLDNAAYQLVEMEWLVPATPAASTPTTAPAGP